MSNQFPPSFAVDVLWEKLVPWLAAHLLHLEQPISVFTNGSGDTTYNYVSLLVYVIVAFLITIFWSALDRQRNNYKKLLAWTIVLIRYYLIYQMLIYGIAKLFYLQFQPPRFSRLIQPYGESSPMGILWTFMGQSKGYTMFTGISELAGGLLLLPRKTVTLGALITFGVMVNVMMLNYCYDVPVKILSSHLVFFAFILIVLDGKRLLNLFLFNRPTKSRIHPMHFQDADMNRAFFYIKWILVISALAFSIYSSFQAMQQYGPTSQKPPMYGLYEVENFVLNGDTLPPLEGDYRRWKRIIIEGKNRASLYTMNNTRTNYSFIPDSTKQVFQIHLPQDTISIDTLYFTEVDSAQYQLKGIFQSDTISMQLLRKQKEDFLLRKTGFSWINEYPFNR